jgi:hypothetical protein
MENTEEKESGLKWLLPLIILVLLVITGYWFCTKPPEPPKPEVGDSKQAVKNILGAFKSLEKTRSSVKDAPPKDLKFEVRVIETEKNEEVPSTSARIVIILQADTSEGASKLAEMYDKAGCICTSSGETEVTCDCSQIPK